MTTIPQSPELAMQELWRQGDAYLRNAVDNGFADINMTTELGRLQIVTSDDERITVTRSIDDMDIEAVVEETRGNGLVDVTYRVEWGWDMRDLPRVYKDMWRGNQSRNVGTVARRNFPMVARSVGQLLVVPSDLQVV